VIPFDGALGQLAVDLSRRILRSQPQNGATSDYLCPQSNSNRHWADFKNDSVGICGQRKQIAEARGNACKTTYLPVAGTATVRGRYGLDSPWTGMADLAKGVGHAVDAPGSVGVLCENARS
jgi:hypothetical protein